MMRSCCLGRDHPRIRGEHILVTPLQCFLHGSSPHTRGARGTGQPGALDRRIIPAYAGSTDDGALHRDAVGDHPRIRGEHPSTSGQVGGDAGSSPHTRGALRFRRVVLELVRIIPAYAGSTTEDSRRVGGQADHPRIRGEHGVIVVSLWDAMVDHPRIRGEHALRRFIDKGNQGSSPHTRGALTAHLLHRRQARIIPAYAGST